MSWISGFKTYDPIALIVGVFFVAVGIWDVFKFLPGTPTVIGLVLLLILVVFLPISFGIAIVRRQLELRRKQ
jgi:hypothetical protein